MSLIQKARTEPNVLIFSHWGHGTSLSGMFATSSRLLPEGLVCKQYFTPKAKHKY